MTSSSIPSAQHLIHHCRREDIRHIVISPGSRNAPLIISFTEDPYFTCYSIVDERCAAFFALGMAQQLQKPVAVVCTSGSALLNFYPAVAEAFYSDIPLVLISADRPNYKIDIGDGQTIRQDHVFDRHIGYSANLKQDVSHATETLRSLAPAMINDQTSIEKQQKEISDFNNEELQKALGIAADTMAPVHINIPFEEPLYNTVTIDEETFSVVEKPVPVTPINEDLSPYLELWNSSKKKMVLVGVYPPNSIEQKILDHLANDPSVLVFTETTSNLHHPNFFKSIDSIIAPIENADNKEVLFDALQPDILLTFGGLIVSKKIKAFLRSYKPRHHWHIHEKKAYDTFFSTPVHFNNSVNSFLKTFLKQSVAVDSTYQTKWLKVKNDYLQKRDVYMNQIPFSDLLAFNHIIAGIPSGYMVQLANSSTVRYTQLFDMDAGVTVFCNRGTSGIDGSTSTALGASLVQKSPTVLITGDLSFFYDSNGLWNKYMRPDFRIIVLNNDGGGIFRILPGKEETENFQNYFETTHDLDVQSLCKVYQLEYQKADSEASLQKALATFYEASGTARVLEIKTPRKLNNEILLAYFDFIS
ncbi:MAG: 2-succinyl-5-enolpyruvyl-6-hydroxy-3-cyclohexene-1-carboxylic-acid synthase [Eudoraea sp.]|nr:2-succinyl-5-enolpyruvyl-6-hydroxy-3-cyclohexene-1-carboxylic-acid synthase [Eudoraea sp.]